METQEQTVNLKSNPSQLYRFRVVQGTLTAQGKLENKKTVGMAYLKDGYNTYTLRLWTFVNDRFYVKPVKANASRFVILTREKNKNQNAGLKTFSNIVGNGHVDSSLGFVQLNFDLLDKPIYMSLFPETFAHSASLPEPEVLDEAA